MKQAEQTSGVPLAGLAVNSGAVAGINEKWPKRSLRPAFAENAPTPSSRSAAVAW
jgi:hypothetical protein